MPRSPRDPNPPATGTSVPPVVNGQVSGYQQPPSAGALAATLLLTGRGWAAFMRRLGEAQKNQILRQVGPVFQFRHAALQDYLAGGQADDGPA
jgi:hypothetical protein